VRLQLLLVPTFVATYDAADALLRQLVLLVAIFDWAADDVYQLH